MYICIYVYVCPQVYVRHIYIYKCKFVSPSSLRLKNPKGLVDILKCQLAYTFTTHGVATIWVLSEFVRLFHKSTSLLRRSPTKKRLKYLVFLQKSVAEEFVFGSRAKDFRWFFFLLLKSFILLKRPSNLRLERQLLQWKKTDLHSKRRSLRIVAAQ